VSSATVRIEADVSAVSRAFGTMRTQYQSALQAMRTDARREAAARVAIERATVVQQGQTQRAAIRAQTQLQRQASRDRARMAAEETRAKAQAEAQAVRLKVQAERDATRAAEKGARDRMRLARQALRDKITEERRAASESQRLYNQQVAAFERVERQRLNLVRSIGREMNRERERLARDAERASARSARTHARGSATGGRALSAVGSAALSVGSNVHGQMVDARRTMAQQQQAAYEAIMEAGGSGADAARESRRIVQTAYQRGIDPETLVSGIRRAQTEFSTLGSADERANMTAAQRSASVTQSVTTAIDRGVRGQRLGADPGEFLRLGGMFEQQGIQGVDDLLVRSIALAQRGAVEQSSLTREAMTPIMARMRIAGDALGPGATPEARQVAMRGAFIQAFSEMEVLKSRGFNTRQGGQAMAGMNQALTNNARVGNIRNNLEVALGNANRNTPEGQARRAAITRLLGTGEGGLFERDPATRDQFRMREAYRGNALAMSEAVLGTPDRPGLDATTAGNIFAGGGRRNAQGMQANWRALFGAMMGQSGDGTTGAQAIRQLQDANLTPADQTRLAEGAENSPMAEYYRREGERISALTDNTGAMGRLSEAFERWTATHPVGAAVGQGLAGLGSTLLAGVAAPKIAGAAMSAASWVRGLFGLGGTAAAATGAGAGGAAAGGGILAPVGAALTSGAALTTAGVTAAAGVGLGAGYGINRAMGHSGDYANPFTSMFYTEFARSVRDGIREGMAAVQVSIDPHAAQQVMASQPAPNGGR
jgi:hypothetical protein